MQTTACAVTMLRDDLFYLEIWLRHYGEILGRENCYVVNHGRERAVARMARGCNIIGLPGEVDPNFDAKRWRLLNNLVHGLRGYYDHVIVGDVDELVILDPVRRKSKSLLDFLKRQPRKQVLTPVGLEVLHLPHEEIDPIGEQLLGPRRFVRLAPHYSKPCVISESVKIARGGHFTQHPVLTTPENLYLLHLKYCDFGEYRATMDRRNQMTEDLGSPSREATIGRHWFANARGEDKALFRSFEDMPRRQGFDMDWVRHHMALTWAPRGETGFWEFDRSDQPFVFELPERFFDVI